MEGDRRHFVILKPFHAKHMQGIFGNSEHTRPWIRRTPVESASEHTYRERVGAGRRTAGRRGSGAGQDGTPTGRLAQRRTVSVVLQGL